MVSKTSRKNESLEVCYAALGHSSDLLELLVAIGVQAVNFLGWPLANSTTS